MKLTGRVRCTSGGFWPEILAGDTVAWAPRHPVFDAWTARAMLAEAVALAGLCFWPPSYLNDRGRELGVSPWVLPAETTDLTPAEREELRAAFERYRPVIARGQP